MKKICNYSNKYLLIIEDKVEFIIDELVILHKIIIINVFFLTSIAFLFFDDIINVHFLYFKVSCMEKSWKDTKLIRIAERKKTTKLCF